MTPELESVRYVANQEMPTMRFTQSKTGHVHSPWFTYDMTSEILKGRMTYGFGRGRYPQIIAAATVAFAQALGIQTESVVVTVKQDPSENFDHSFRLGTAHPCALPKVQKKEVTTKIPSDGAIEV